MPKKGKKNFFTGLAKYFFFLLQNECYARSVISDSLLHTCGFLMEKNITA